MSKKILLGDVTREKKIPSRKLVKVYQADNGVTYRPRTNILANNMVTADVSVYGYPIKCNMLINDPEIIKQLREPGEETVYEFDGDKVVTDVFEPGTIWSYKKRLYVSDGEGLFLVDVGNTILVESDDHPNDDNDEDDDYEDNEGIATLSEMRQPVENVISGLVSSIRYNTYETVNDDMVLLEEYSIHGDILQQNQTFMIIENGFNYDQKSKTKMVNLLKDKILTVPENHHVGLMLSDNEDHMFRFDKLGILTFRVYSRADENDEWHDTGYETLKRVERLKQNDVIELNELFKFNGIDSNEFELCRDLIDFDDYELGYPFESITTLSFISKAGEPPRLYLTINVAKSESERDVHEFKTYDLENNKWETYPDLSKLVDWVVYRTCYTNAICQNMNVIGGNKNE